MDWVLSLSGQFGFNPFDLNFFFPLNGPESAQVSLLLGVDMADVSTYHLVVHLDVFNGFDAMNSSKDSSSTSTLSSCKCN